MDIHSIKATAADSLTAAPYRPGRLALVHTGAALGLSLLLTVANFLLTRQIDTTAGLSGIGTRTILSVIQTLLSIAGSAMLPFWELGFLRAALCMARRENADKATLLEGFRRFGPVLRLLLLRGILYIAVAVLCLQFASIVFMLSPLSNAMLETMEQLMSNPEAAVMDTAAMEALMPTMYPAYVIFGILLCVVLIPIVYRFRLADWAVMDKAPGAFAAIRLSSYAMRGKRFQFFRLDLSFWWYYALQLLAAAIAYGDLLLAALGVTANADAAFFGFYTASLLLQLALAWRFAPQIQTAYALAYDRLRSIPAPAQSVPKNLPWN